MATPKVTTVTQNLAHLMAFMKACEWAAVDPSARDKPVCLRYDNEYGAMIATGTWKAKKHKGVAEAAQRAWARLLKTKPEDQVWLRHAAVTHLKAQAARGLAARGKGGETVYTMTSVTVD